MPEKDTEVEYVPGGLKLAHVIHQCPPDGDTPYCESCKAGSIRCEVCDGAGAERTLTTDCPGIKLFPAVADAIMEGRLDYKNGFWIDPRRPVPATLAPTPKLTLIGTYLGEELYADTSAPPGKWILEDASEMEKRLERCTTSIPNYGSLARKSSPC